jgi:RLL motif-containing protein 1
MFRRKLQALDYQSPSDTFSDESSFRGLISWLEDQKIRHYKIEDRAGLRDAGSSDWPKAFKKYLEDLSCPIADADKNSLIDWILGYAVRLEYGDNTDKYRSVTATKVSTAKGSNPLENLDFNDAEFKAGVASLAQLLQIPPHPDHLVVLKAVCLVVKEKLSKEALEKAQREKGTKPLPTLPLDKMELGFETSDYVTQEAAKILRLLHIRELRELQTLANEAIVAVQTLTANPKTDTKLGKVGT